MLKNTWPIILCLLAACSSGKTVSTGSFGMQQFPMATAQTPVATGYPLTTQQKMQAMHHWDRLAEHVASQASLALDHFMPDSKAGVYIAPAGNTPFAKSYREALITHFVAYGIPVAFSPEGNAVLEVSSELVNHGRKLVKTDSGAYRTLEPGFRQEKDGEGEYKRLPLVAGESGYFDDGQPTTEMQVNTSLIFQNSYLYRNSSIFYVDSAEWRHYRHQAPQGSTQLKQYSLVGK